MTESRIDFRRAKFLISAPDIAHLDQYLPGDIGVEIAFAGRSNAGKSSALNALTEQKSLARTSKTPGRTQLINVFQLDDDRRLVDLPGYGFAQVPLALKNKWQEALGEYLQKRACLSGVVVLMDIRHPLKDLDMQMIEWAVISNIPVLALLTKSDKLTQSVKMKTVNDVRAALKDFGDKVQVETLSSLKGTGKPKVLSILNDWCHPQWLAEQKAEQASESE
ncbi:YihA family ribosome biogenesis GTP-binding protein [Shewanella sp. SR43-4]|uniref:Probable GTP-binding protein EngB n=1 Tax=Shewanella vesiculosa TaxID=518738 RepID=A0ABV0FSA3_9GAMM|nr:MULTISPECIES: ribosome biogenesis GTP-binding protein YihA/YsxC [Shewanella]NCQ45766.1 YihA family ribosome biogenesis GTP-binding protein [Shewanella frigidimarina]MBB1318524.1 YihA family ribosome biogenesis GTP-binding protein [Shewanella sp. SR43-4]MBB1322501.1 YihA family ribosome biogenesis GTP-binding protein [Shewanella sp. SR43-8]MBB1390709.1 YihA family ribosome biogenesis GTP-binding protein [Shewanella sp. SG44-6]MBB1476940.1 YihA family ribosome biogenesis GTP-binding protein [